ncbi:MAG: nitroreductase family protein [Proteobacteria bacterium]|nr:nitroreductase family protein [Pseudomonadota bacterium]
MSSKSDVFQNMRAAAPINDGNPIPSPEFAASHLAAFQEVLKARRSIRIYDGQPIPEAIMRDCLGDAILAPSSSNLQSYELYWIRDQSCRKAVVEACLSQPAASTAGELVVVVARADLWPKNLKKLLAIMGAGGRTLSPSVKFYYETLIPKLMSSDPFGFRNLLRRIGFFYLGLKKPGVRSPKNAADFRVFGHTQAALAAQTLMLSFTAHGYDTCPMGGFDAVRLSKALKLPRGAEVCMVISAGTRKPEGLYGPRIRLDSSELIKTI